MSTQEFDPKGHYKEVISAVEDAGDGKARIFRIEHGGTRSEIFVVSMDRDGQKVIGLKALAIES